MKSLDNAKFCEWLYRNSGFSTFVDSERKPSKDCGGSIMQGWGTYVSWLSFVENQTSYPLSLSLSRICKMGIIPTSWGVPVWKWILGPKEKTQIQVFQRAISNSLYLGDFSGGPVVEIYLPCNEQDADLIIVRELEPICHRATQPMPQLLSRWGACTTTRESLCTVAPDGVEDPACCD